MRVQASFAPQSSRSGMHKGTEIVVRVFKYWNDVNLLRQTPQSSGVWRSVRFHIDTPGDADYVVIHGHVGSSTRVRCPNGRIWLNTGEAPTEWSSHWADAPRWINRIYMSDERKAEASTRHFESFPALPWHVSRDFDFLTRCPPPQKVHPLSWITSNLTLLPGHKRRMAFLGRIRGLSALHLFGRGFTPLVDKWDGLAPYEYSIAFENFSNAHYWTEKLADCYLTWTMPIYFGCTDLSKYFPKDSYIQLDPEMDDPCGFLMDIIGSGIRNRNLDAIDEARKRVLTDYNFFEWVVREIEADSIRGKGSPSKRLVVLRDHTKSWRDTALGQAAMHIAKTGLPPWLLRLYQRHQA